jgi:hypothetical protein
MNPAFAVIMHLWTYHPDDPGYGLYRYWRQECAYVFDGKDHGACSGILTSSFDECSDKGNQITAKHEGWYFTCEDALSGEPSFPELK